MIVSTYTPEMHVSLKLNIIRSANSFTQLEDAFESLRGLVKEKLLWFGEINAEQADEYMQFAVEAYSQRRYEIISYYQGQTQ